VPQEIVPDLEESDEKDLERARSSLIVIENPSLHKRLTILMAKATMPYNGDKTFLDVYFITADEDYNVVEQPLKQRGARVTTKQVGGQLLYIVSDENEVEYPIASPVPHEPCRISPKEFQGFETTIVKGNLDGMVNSMVQLMGERLKDKGFSLDDGKLVLPPEYASMQLPY